MIECMSNGDPFFRVAYTDQRVVMLDVNNRPTWLDWLDCISPSECTKMVSKWSNVAMDHNCPTTTWMVPDPKVLKIVQKKAYIQNSILLAVATSVDRKIAEAQWWVSQQGTQLLGLWGSLKWNSGWKVMGWIIKRMGFLTNKKPLWVGLLVKEYHDVSHFNCLVGVDLIFWQTL